MAKYRRFSTTALVIASLALVIITLVLVIWLPAPGELASRRTFDELSQARIGPIRWSNVTLHEAVADVNAQLEKKGETKLRLFVSEAFVATSEIAVSMQLEDVPVTECARYLCDLSFASMSGSREGITFGTLHLHSPPEPPPWRARVRHWVSYHLWERWRAAPAAPAPGAAPPGPPPVPSSGGANPFGAPPAAPAVGP